MSRDSIREAEKALAGIGRTLDEKKAKKTSSLKSMWGMIGMGKTNKQRLVEQSELQRKYDLQEEKVYRLKQEQEKMERQAAEAGDQKDEGVPLFVDRTTSDWINNNLKPFR
ncbi:TPA: hypothetical protein EYO57_20725 [Candidatus Poribacteria bacterium]|nr:hypothetical protein [Candidatus Poribacteria bacterium]